MQQDFMSESSEARVPWDGESFLDCETAALLRAALGPAFDSAESWGALLAHLGDKGYALAFRGGRLILTDAGTGRRLCTTRCLGQPFSELVERFGRPAVRVVSGRDAAAELVA